MNKVSASKEKKTNSPICLSGSMKRPDTKMYIPKGVFLNETKIDISLNGYVGSSK